MNARKSSTASIAHLTVRGLPPEIARALDVERRRRGTSLNQTVIDLLARSLGVGEGETRSNGLRELAGTWSAEDQARFEEATAFSEQIDEELWR